MMHEKQQNYIKTQITKLVREFITSVEQLARAVNVLAQNNENVQLTVTTDVLEAGLNLKQQLTEEQNEKPNTDPVH